jgi:hypothetical protein
MRHAAFLGTSPATNMFDVAVDPDDELLAFAAAPYATGVSVLIDPDYSTTLTLARSNENSGVVRTTDGGLYWERIAGPSGVAPNARILDRASTTVNAAPTRPPPPPPPPPAGGGNTGSGGSGSGGGGRFDWPAIGLLGLLLAGRRSKTRRASLG